MPSSRSGPPRWRPWNTPARRPWEKWRSLTCRVEPKNAWGKAGKMWPCFYLVGVLEHGILWLSIYWEYSSQLTFIFFRGVGIPPTSYHPDQSKHVQNPAIYGWCSWVFPIKTLIKTLMSDLVRGFPSRQWWHRSGFQFIMDMMGGEFL